MTDWSASGERGGRRALRVMLWLTQHTGWLAGLVLRGVTAWYYLGSPAARRASREFLSVARGRPARARDVYRHLHVFACAIVDRVTPAGLHVDVDGLPLLEAAVARGAGCLLLGGHVGSFEVLRRLADHAPVAVRALMYRSNAGALTRLFQQLDPAADGSVIPIGDVQSLLRVHEAVAAGGVVGILADRAPAGARVVEAPFFGRRAAFPAGPLVLAASLGCPVLTFYAARVGARHYRIHFEPFADRVALRREARQADLQDVAARYAAWLEATCRRYPFNWFNFYPFWETHAPPQTRGRPLARPTDRAAPSPNQLAPG